MTTNSISSVMPVDVLMRFHYSKPTLSPMGPQVTKLADWEVIMEEGEEKS